MICADSRAVRLCASYKGMPWFLLLVFLCVGLVPASTEAKGICSIANVTAYMAKGKRNTRIHKGKFYRAIMKHYSVFRKDGDHFVGTDSILDKWNERRDLVDPRWLAYMLATSYLETAARMYPVRETLAKNDATAIRYLQSANRKGKIRARYMYPHKKTGHVYFGRGYVQLTWDYNYIRADRRLKITEDKNRFFLHPKHALDPKKSVFILL